MSRRTPLRTLLDDDRDTVASCLLILERGMRRLGIDPAEKMTRMVVATESKRGAVDEGWIEYADNEQRTAITANKPFGEKGIGRLAVSSLGRAVLVWSRWGKGAATERTLMLVHWDLFRQPRTVDKPANRIEDIHGMADFISCYPGVDAARLGLLGICGGGGYSLAAAQTDKRFKSVATLSMFNSGRVRRNGFADSQLGTIQERLRQASAARAQAAAGGEVLYSGDANLTDEQIARLPFEMYRQGYEYYWRTHAHPNSTFKYTTSSLLDLMRFDATNQIELIDRPLLMIAGSKADSLYMSEDAFAKATGTKDKELFKIEGATHIETYWVPRFVDAAIGRLIAFYGRTL